MAKQGWAFLLGITKWMKWRGFSGFGALQKSSKLNDVSQSKQNPANLQLARYVPVN